jgi:hypothetical protein
MNKILIFLICLFVFNVKAQVKIGTSGAIEPTGDFSAIRSYNVGGGFKYYSDTADVPDKFKDSTLVVYQPLDSSFYRFNSGSWIELRVNKRIIAGNNIVISGDTISTISSGAVGNADSLGGFSSNLYIRRTELEDSLNALEARFPVVPTVLSGFTNDVGFITNPYDGDSSVTNELQNISFNKVGNNITGTITNGTGDTFTIDDGDSDPTNEKDTVSAGFGINVSQSGFDYEVEVDTTKLVTVPRFLDSLDNFKSDYEIDSLTLTEAFEKHQRYFNIERAYDFSLTDSSIALTGLRSFRVNSPNSAIHSSQRTGLSTLSTYLSKFQTYGDSLYFSVNTRSSDLLSNKTGHASFNSYEGFKYHPGTYNNNFTVTPYTIPPAKWVQAKLDTLADSINVGGGSSVSSFKSCYKKVTADFTFSTSDTTCNIQNLSNDTIVVTFNSLSIPNGSVTNFWNNGDEGLFLFQKGTSNIKVGGVSVNTDTVLATASVMYVNDTFYVANAVSIEGGSSSNASTLNGQTGAYYLNRSNHTGTQAISTVVNLQDSLDNKVNNSTLNNYYTKSEVDSKIDSVVSYHDSITNLRIDSINTAFSYGEYEISANDTITDEWFNRTNWTYSTANTDTITIYLDTGLTVPAYTTVADLFISGTNPIKIQCINSTRINGIVNGSASISTRYSGAGLRKIYNGFEDFALTPAD